jgi:hypothetical protein
MQPRYKLGIFLALPIANIAVIRDENDHHQEAFDKASASSLPVIVKDE